MPGYRLYSGKTYASSSLRLEDPAVSVTESAKLYVVRQEAWLQGQEGARYGGRPAGWEDGGRFRPVAATQMAGGLHLCHGVYSGDEYRGASSKYLGTRKPYPEQKGQAVP